MLEPGMKWIDDTFQARESEFNEARTLTLR
jgi:hypothetical protein